MLQILRSHCKAPAPTAVFSQPVPVSAHYGITELGRRALLQHDSLVGGSAEPRSDASVPTIDE